MTVLRYTTVRFIPDPIRDEVVNLGLIMGATDGSWFRARFLKSYAKVQAIGGKGAVAYAKALIRDLEAGIPMDGAQGRMFSDDNAFEAYFTASAESVAMVRLAEPLAAVSDDPESLFDDMYRQLIGAYRRPARPAGSRPVNREQLRRAFRTRALEDWSLPAAYLSEEGVLGTLRHPVDFGLFNGRLRSVVHTVSFAGDVDWAVLQRAVLTEAAVDIRSAGMGDVRFALLYAPAPNGSLARKLERESVAFAERQGILPVQVRQLDDLKHLVELAGHSN